MKIRLLKNIDLRPGEDRTIPAGTVGELVPPIMIRTSSKEEPVRTLAQLGDKQVYITDLEYTILSDGSGVKHDQGKPDFSMISYELMEAVARVREFGARKYSVYGECTCTVQNVTKIEKFGLKSFASPVITLTMINCTEIGSESIKKNTERLIEKSSENTNELMLREILGILQIEGYQHLNEPTTSQTKNLLDSLVNLLVQFVVKKRSSVLTMTTLQEEFEKDFVNPATLLLDSWKKLNGSEKHYPTCQGLNLVKTGRDNWKKGFKVTRSLAAVLRHIFLFLSGETNDSESGLSHLAHAVCGLEHALYDMRYHPENDDREIKK